MNEISHTALWRPGPERLANAELTHFTAWLNETRGLDFPTYESLWQWSVTEIEDFWEAIWQWFAIESDTPYKQVLRERKMPGAVWFEGATLNFTRSLLTRADEADSATREALVFHSELVDRESLSWAALRDQVRVMMQTLTELGVEPGDRVVSYMPNIPQTLVAILATAGVGAIWSSCAPDMGATGVLDRFTQIEPKVIFAVDGYRYGGKDYNRTETVASLVEALPSLRGLVYVPILAESEASLSPDPFVVAQACAQHPGPLVMLSWAGALTREPLMECLPVNFEHPLWIVYSSGTTGMPKPIVHSHGGALLESLKANRFHLDVGPQDRFFWFSSTSWIMWNLWVGTLASGATLLHYDGNPGHPDLHTLWAFAAREKASFFGTSPAFISMNIKAGLRPGQEHDLSSLRTLGATGSPLTEESYEWVYQNVKDDILLASISGGTDPGAAFLTSSPTLPVYPGQMQCRGLGCAVYSFNDGGEAQIGEVGELVVTQPLPSMPLFFWGDTDGERYRSSYFETWPGVWQHGDWVALFDQPESVTSIVYGRSDSTINRHGIRMGSSEIYRVVEGFEEVLESLVIDLEFLGRPSELLLFVVLREADEHASGKPAPDELTVALNKAIASQLSHRHVPNQIWQIAAVPRTMSGKKLEVPIKRILLGQESARVLNKASMANPDSADWFVHHARTRGEAKP